MCEDCEQAAEAVVANKPKCRCAKCRVAGNVLAVERPSRAIEQGLGPWCVACHHFILTMNKKPE
jgi:hypothetical protein